MEIRFNSNPKNEKDKVIIDVLSGEYSASETVKNILNKIGKTELVVNRCHLRDRVIMSVYSLK